MSTLNYKQLSLRLILALLVPIGFHSYSSLAQSPDLGTPIDTADVSEFDLIVGPDGDGLPLGSGNADSGKAVYEARCQACHGVEGEGTIGNTRLVGGNMQSVENPLRTVGSFWPHATTLFDFIRRAMPADAPKSLSNEEVYQVTAYVLFLNGIVDQAFNVNKDSLPAIAMPNRNGFVDQSHVQ